MSIYHSVLPEAGFVCFEVPETLAAIAIALLANADGPATCGSSFALTADVHQSGMRNLWLSRVSAQRLQIWYTEGNAPEGCDLSDRVNAVHQKWFGREVNWEEVQAVLSTVKWYDEYNKARRNGDR